MSLSLLPARVIRAGRMVSRAAFFGVCLATGPNLLLAQNSYLPLGGEYSISGSLPGDQVYPQLSVSSYGGFLLWEDNGTADGGIALRAVPLDTGFSRLQTPFQINRATTGEHRAARATLLKSGGAAFVWQ